jgi:hypothetical protein
MASSQGDVRSSPMVYIPPSGAAAAAQTNERTPPPATSTARHGPYLLVRIRVRPERHRAQSCAIALSGPDETIFTSQGVRMNLHSGTCLQSIGGLLRVLRSHAAGPGSQQVLRAQPRRAKGQPVARLELNAHQQAPGSRRFSEGACPVAIPFHLRLELRCR